MTPLCCSSTMPTSAQSKGGVLTAEEHDRIFAERKALWEQWEQDRLAAVNKNLRGRAKIISALGHEQTGFRKGKGAVGHEENGALKRVIVLNDGHRNHRTVPTQLGPYMILQAGKAYVSGVRSGLHGALEEDRCNEERDPA